MAYSSLHFCSSVGFLAVILLCILLICKKLVFFLCKIVHDYTVSCSIESLLLFNFLCFLGRTFFMLILSDYSQRSSLKGDVSH